MSQRLVAGAAALRGTILVPADKSIGHRALLANAIADGEATVRLRAPGRDLTSTIGCLAGLGINIRHVGDAVVVGGPQLRAPSPSSKPCRDAAGHGQLAARRPVPQGQNRDR